MKTQRLPMQEREKWRRNCLRYSIFLNSFKSTVTLNHKLLLKNCITMIFSSLISILFKVDLDQLYSEPAFSVICSFFNKFGAMLGVKPYSFSKLEQLFTKFDDNGRSEAFLANYAECEDDSSIKYLFKLINLSWSRARRTEHDSPEKTSVQICEMGLLGEVSCFFSNMFFLNSINTVFI